MRLNIVLVDYENVQPNNLNKLDINQFKVYIFLGANQKNIPKELAVSLQNFGQNGKYIQLSTSGKNALDFCIAYYAGILSKEHNDAYFHIISKDTGFDPLIEHLKTQKIFCTRSSSVEEIPMLKISIAVTTKEKVKLYTERFNNPNTSKPRKQETLYNSINTFFKKELNKSEIDAIISTMESTKFIENDNGKIIYINPSLT